jgi:hypothetical protein
VEEELRKHPRNVIFASNNNFLHYSNIIVQGDGWLSWYGSSLGSNPDISQKYKIGDKSKGVANTIQSAKKYTKKTVKTAKKRQKNQKLTVECRIHICINVIWIRNCGLTFKGFIMTLL